MTSVAAKTEVSEAPLNRELSWLDYNARVLDQAANPGLPLLERARNCAYFSSNLDEFFMVRVAGLMGQEEAGLAVRSPDGRTPRRRSPRSGRACSSSARSSRSSGSASSARRSPKPGSIVGDVDDCNRKELEELEERSSVRSSRC